jgi:PilZ domain
MISAPASPEAKPQGQRRSNDRYPVAADVAYKLMGDGRILTGRSVNMSSKRLLIATEAALPPGVLIEVQIDWPARLDDCVCLSLHVRGRTLRCNGNHTAIAIAGYEFPDTTISPSRVHRCRLSVNANLVVQDYVQQ